MRLGSAPGMVDGFTAAPLQFLQVVRDRISDGAGAGPRVVAFLAPQLRAPPCACRLLRLSVVENRHAVRVLQIVAGSHFVFDVATVSRPPSREPRAALAPAAVAECKTLL